MAATKTKRILYPTSDGKPMAETEIHRDIMVDGIDTLKGRYADQDDVCVSGNLLVYYEEGNPRRHRAPDIFVVWGVPKRLRVDYKIWQERKAPDVVFEITSKTTKKEDTQVKFRIYRDIWKVKEYFLFDPLEEYLDPSLQGHRLVRGKFLPIEPDDEGRVVSKLLGLALERQGPRLAFRDLASGKLLLRPDQQCILDLRVENEDLRRELDALRQQQPRTNHRRNGM